MTVERKLTVYVAFEGEYSDRHCIGVFDSKKAAENALKKRRPDEEHEVEEHELQYDC